MDPEPAPAEGVSIRVAVEDGRRGGPVLDVDGLARLLAASLRHCGVRPPAEVGLHLVDAHAMSELNHEHMGSDGPTDVLAFPIDGTETPPPGQPALVGDVVICPDVAARAAQPLDDELALLVVHGALHLVGYDHAEPDQEAEMKALEAELLARHDRAGAGRS